MVRTIELLSYIMSWCWYFDRFSKWYLQQNKNIATKFPCKSSFLTQHVVRDAFHKKRLDFTDASVWVTTKIPQFIRALNKIRRLTHQFQGTAKILNSLVRPN